MPMFAPTTQDGGSWLSQGNNKWIVAIGGVVGLVVIFFILGRGGSSGGVTSGGQSSSLSDDISQLNDLIAGLGAGGGGGGGGSGSTGFTGGNPGDAIYTPPLSPTQPPSSSPYPGYGTINPTYPYSPVVAPTPVTSMLPTPTVSPVSGISSQPINLVPNPTTSPITSKGTQPPTGGTSSVGPVNNPANPISYTANPRTATSPPKQVSTYIPSPKLVTNPGNVGYPGSGYGYSNVGVAPTTKPSTVVIGTNNTQVPTGLANLLGAASVGQVKTSPKQATQAAKDTGATSSSREMNRPVATTSSSPKPATKATPAAEPKRPAPKTTVKAF